MNCGRHIKGNRDPVIVLHSDVCKHVGPNAGMATYDAEDCAMGCYGGCYFFFGEEKGLERKDRTLTELMPVLGVLKTSPSLCFGIQRGRQLLTW